MNWLEHARNFEMGLGPERTGERIVIVDFPNGSGIEKHVGYREIKPIETREIPFYLREARVNPDLFEELLRRPGFKIELIHSEEGITEYHPKRFGQGNFDFISFYAFLRGNPERISPSLRKSAPPLRDLAYARYAC